MVANKNVSGERTIVGVSKTRLEKLCSSKVHTLPHYECRDFEQRVDLDVVFALINAKYSRRHFED